MHGNVEFVIQSIPATNSGNTRLFARTDYVYDLLSHKVKEVKYNYYQSDSYTQKYSYDADNRLTHVESSRYGQIMENDASYFYYPHGPLRRIELGKDRVQGLDYTYTIQGWLKAINNNSVAANMDPGRDGSTSGSGMIKPEFPVDAFGTVLNYFDGDFSSASNMTATNRFNSTVASDRNLYDGNIAKILTLNSSSVANSKVADYSFQYDFLGRLKTSTDLTNLYPISAPFNSTYSYDDNGNLLNLQRTHKSATTVGNSIDNLTYNYANPNQNRLTSVSDASGSALTGEFLDGTDAYTYDASGNLTSETGANGTRSMKWTADGKVKEITFVAPAPAANATNKITYLYDAQGNRVAKIASKNYVAPTAPAPPIPEKQDRTLYARDANGQVMAVYENVDQPIGDPTITSCLRIQCSLEAPINPPFCIGANSTWIITVCNPSDYKISDDKIEFLNPISLAPSGITFCSYSYSMLLAPCTFKLSDLEKGAFASGIPLMVIKLLPNSGTYKLNSQNLVNHTISNTSMMPQLAEWHIYGNEQQGRFSIRKPERPTYFLQGISNEIANNIFTRQIGKKEYELKDHLGNVRTVIKDVKEPTEHYTYHPMAPYSASIVSTSEYYPFGWEIKLAGAPAIANNYRYGYNGMERDNDVKGEGNFLDFGAREYDPRIAMFTKVDPFRYKFPSESPYIFAGDDPINMIDVDGKYKKTVTYTQNEKGEQTLIDIVKDNTIRPFSYSFQGIVPIYCNLVEYVRVDDKGKILSTSGELKLENIGSTRYPGPFNPPDLAPNKPDYRYPPINAVDAAGMEHDKGYDALWIHGAGGMLSSTEAIGYDMKLVERCLDVMVRFKLGLNDKVSNQPIDEEEVKAAGAIAILFSGMVGQKAARIGGEIVLQQAEELKKKVQEAVVEVGIKIGREIENEINKAVELTQKAIQVGRETLQSVSNEVKGNLQKVGNEVKKVLSEPKNVSPLGGVER